MHRALDWPRHFGNGTLLVLGRHGVDERDDLLVGQALGISR